MLLKSNKKGFTLIELLVVIAIIGLLSSVVLASLNQARMKARDSKRTQEMSELKKALELYYSDNGFYPSITSDHPETGYKEISSTDSGWLNNTNILGLALVPTYISKLPTDPVNSGGVLWNNSTNYSYLYATYAGQNDSYDLVTRLEIETNNSCPNVDYVYLDTDGETLASWCDSYGNILGNRIE